MRLACEGEEVIVTKNGKDIVRIVACDRDDMVAEASIEYLVEGKKRVTYEEFLEMTANSDLRYELIDGEVFLLSSPLYPHQAALTEIAGHFYNWFKGKKCRPLVAPFDVTLAKSEKNINVVQPDILVICDIEKIDPKGRYKGVPTLVVEILSENNRRHDLVRKLDLYLQTGVEEYWVVDPEKNGVWLYNFNEKNIMNYQVFIEDSVVKSNVFPGLEIRLREIFTVA